MREKQNPLEFLSSLLDEGLFHDFTNYVITELCVPFTDELHGTFIKLPHPETGEITTYAQSHTEIMELEVKKAKEQLLCDIAVEIVQKEDGKYKRTIVDHYLSSISYTASKIDSKKHLAKYPFIKEIIAEIQTTLIEKYELQYANIACSKSKFQWLGNINVLTTLFHDLLYGQDKKSPLLSGKETELKKFLAEHFIDKDGQPLVSDTINKYFSIQRRHAKLGDRITLP